MGFLDGNEIDKKFDNGAGEVILDVTPKGEVKFGVTYGKEVSAIAKINANINAETNIFKIAEMITAKTKVTWDDTLVKQLELLLGIAG